MSLVHIRTRPDRVLLLQLDGKLPNLALMRIAAHHRNAGTNWRSGTARNSAACSTRNSIAYTPAPFSSGPARWRTASWQAYPHAVIGGTGWDVARTIEDIGITHRTRGLFDLSRVPAQHRVHAAGVPPQVSILRRAQQRRAGSVRAGKIAEIWRGEPWPREIVLLDNDFFGNPEWRDRLQETAGGPFKVCFTQGINARILTPEQAEGIASVDYRDSNLAERRLYTAWDTTRDEARFFAGLELLCRNGVRPRHLLVYMLIGYAPGETHADRDHRRRKLREFGALPYPMPYRRTPELVGFQRWVVGAYDKRVRWEDWQAANYQPRQLRHGRKRWRASCDRLAVRSGSPAPPPGAAGPRWAGTCAPGVSAGPDPSRRADGRRHDYGLERPALRGL